VRARRIAADAELGSLLESPPEGIDPVVLGRLRYMHEAGAWVLLESAIADLPADLRWLLESDAVTIEQLATIHARLGATTAFDLGEAVRRGLLRTLPGVDADVDAAIARALPTLRTSVPRVALGRASAIAEPLIDLVHGLPAVEWAECAGSVRRGQDTVGDIDIVVATNDPLPVLGALSSSLGDRRCLLRAGDRVHLLVDRSQVSVRSVPTAVAGAWLLCLTGSAEHLLELRALAAARGWSLDTEGLRHGEERIAGAREEDIYDRLGLPWIPAEVRHGDDEIAAARSGSLPTLIDRTDIRGDLHLHTDYSDGRDPLPLMVDACDRLGYEYIAITDHSPHSASARNLSVESAKRQADEIAALRERYGRMTILHGCEVDILGDGRLDFSDKILQRFDIVLASLHEALGHAPEQILRRYLAAMRHPLVNVITHPANRIVPGVQGYALDYDRLFEAAVETGTALEIDGAPQHLDLDGALARKARAAGATLVVDSDCHRTEMLDRQMRLGVITARRGWVEPRHVLNTQPVDNVRAFVAGKRLR
jgi:DNA polymerase (family 10)